MTHPHWRSIGSSLTSPGERRLWAWTLAVVAAILSTLGLARTLAAELRDRELLGISGSRAVIGRPVDNLLELT